MSTFKELLGRVTPGKWREPFLWDGAGMVKNAIVHDPLPGKTWKSDTADICYFPPDMAQNRANAQYIARLNPETMKLVLEALELSEAVLKAVHAHRDVLPKDLAIAVKTRADLNTEALQALNSPSP